MPTKYCPFSGCGTKIVYETTSPSKCPKCHQVLASAFKVTPVEEPHQAAAQTRAQPKVSAVKSSIMARRRAEQQPEEEPVDVSTPEVEDDFATASYDGYINPQEVRRRARELAASIDPSTIHVSDGDETPVRFGDWCGRPKS